MFKQQTVDRRKPRRQARRSWMTLTSPHLLFRRPSVLRARTFGAALNVCYAEADVTARSALSLLYPRKQTFASIAADVCFVP